jgi:hypothetical protein
MMEEMASALGRALQDVLEACNIGRFYLCSLPFRKRRAGGAVNDLVDLIQDFVILGFIHPEEGLFQVPLDNPDS